MENKTEWYRKLLRKLNKIKSGELDLDEYIDEVKAKIEAESQALSMSGVSEWISVETPPHDQETVLLIDSYNQVSTGYFHGPKSGFIWDAPDLNDPINWKRIVK